MRYLCKIPKKYNKKGSTERKRNRDALFRRTITEKPYYIPLE